ncbi:hypothetical protein AAIE21_27575 [Paenibacillus sp. 102]|uniref:hypothetical protein n=1 Tax=Paenibacillus sp. 102 TaxID=3120823 RepID=UPI0031BB9824
MKSKSFWTTLIIFIMLFFTALAMNGHSEPKKPIAELNYNQDAQNITLTITKFEREKGKLHLELDMKNNSEYPLITTGTLSLIDNDKILSLPLELNIGNKTIEKNETKSLYYEWNNDKKPSVFDSIIIDVNGQKFKTDLLIEDDE